MTKKAQSATEFVVLIFFMFVVFFVFFFAIQSQIRDSNEHIEQVSLEELGGVVHSYLTLASNSYVDFKKQFTLPLIDNLDYEIFIEDNNTLVVKKGSKEFVDFLPFEVKGYLNKASPNNIVYNLDGKFITSSGIIENNDAKGLFLNVDAENCALRKFKSLSCTPQCQSIGIC